MASTSRCPRPGWSPWGSSEGRVPSTECRWRGAQLQVETALGEGRERKVSPSGSGGRNTEVSGWGQAFWFPLPPPSFQCLNSSSTSLLSPPSPWAGFPARKGVKTAHEAKTHLLLVPRQGRADGHVAEAQGGQILGAEWPQGEAGT